MIRNIVVTCKILQKEVGLNDADYRALLKRYAGVNSSKELTNQNCMSVISALESLKPKKEEKPIIDFSKLYKSSLVKSKPWNKSFNLPEEKWEDIGNVIHEYGLKGITVVACWPAYGPKYIKWRYE